MIGEPIAAGTAAGATEAGPWRARWWMLKSRLRQLRRRWIPHLVWHGDELDVRVTWRFQALDPMTGDTDLQAAIGKALHQFNSGVVFEIERALAEHGVRFDTGMGYGGRDWEWDWSLRGPVSVTFVGRASKPERRTFAWQSGEGA